MKLSKEEKYILEEYEKDRIKPRTPSQSEIEEAQRTAKNTLKKDKRITIRLYDHDYKSIQKKALEMGIPYQTLISGLIHQYVEGELVKKQ